MTDERRIRVNLPDPAVVVAQDEADHQPPWWRRHLGRIVAGFLIVLAGVLYVNSRVNPPPSPPNAATQEQLDKLRSDLDQYLAGRGGLRDQQYAKTVYTLCVLAQDAGDTDILNDPDYDCAGLLAAPPPSVPSSAPPVTSASPSASSSGPAPSSTRAPVATPTVTTSPRPTASVTPTPSSSAAPTVAPATPTPTPLLSGVLCNLPILTLCPGG